MREGNAEGREEKKEFLLTFYLVRYAEFIPVRGRKKTFASVWRAAGKMGRTQI